MLSLGRRIAALVFVLALAAVPASAHRSPSAAEKRAITAAVKSSSLTSAVPDSHFAVAFIRISTVSPKYAAGAVLGVGQYKRTVQSALVLLRRTAGLWRLIDIGGVLGCSAAPRAVLRDLSVSCE